MRLKRGIDALRDDDNTEERRRSGSPARELSDSDDYMTMRFSHDDEHDETTTRSSDDNDANKPVSEIMPRGLAMMRKMGYTPDQDSGSEPAQKRSRLIPIMMKSNREGIRESRNLKKDPEMEINTKTFKATISKETDFKRKEAIFHRMQKIAFELSHDDDLFTSEADPRDFNVLWRRFVIELKQKTGRTRTQPRLLSRLIENDDKREPDIHDGLGSETEDEELKTFEELTIDQRILGLHTFSRVEFYYCFYCGVKYASEEDMFENCPGPSESDHV
ncbi:LAMI_0C06524g1_1 [Lachancea mirantina]|uniref:LAMI_0C06524g1_1 n=1 Tax=Lachancea mirantina TaxID=1230905 RepID=A0A1G4J3R7_9SACH|nr:LAMI_0C06524g1_1 [Lachancea mirantina]